VDPFKGASTAQRVAEQSSVLLKNANSLLPIDAARVKSIAIIGSKADTSVLSGGGSAQVDPPGGGASRFGGPAVWFPSSPLKAVRGKAPRAKVEYHDGVDVKAAAAFAKASEIAIVFVNEYTTEGRDLPSLNLSGAQNELVSAVAAANPRTIVVLETGGPAAMPWIDIVGAAIEIWYPGLRGAEALANILFGDVNPQAKLPATFPRSDADLPHPVIFGSDQRPTPQATPPPGGVTAPPQRFQMKPFDIDYTEGLKVGYKWFQAENKKPLFAFGHGLSYTSFAYSDVTATIDSVSFKGAQHRQARRGRDRPGVRLAAGVGQRTAEASGRVGEGRVVTRGGEDGDFEAGPEVPVHLQRGEGRLGTPLGRLPDLRGRRIRQHAIVRSRQTLNGSSASLSARNQRAPTTIPYDPLVDLNLATK
jgi:hypothetical protein